MLLSPRPAETIEGSKQKPAFEQLRNKLEKNETSMRGDLSTTEQRLRRLSSD
jgi:hypothetical protein